MFNILQNLDKDIDETNFTINLENLIDEKFFDV